MGWPSAVLSTPPVSTVLWFEWRGWTGHAVTAATVLQVMTPCLIYTY
jgi:hypothetical protein